MKPKKRAVVNIKEEYERIQREEEEKRLATEKQINEIMSSRNYQYLATVSIMGAEVPLSQIINPQLVVMLRVVSKPKE